MATKQQNPDSSLGVCVTGDPSGEAFVLVRDDGRFFVKFLASGRCVSAWSLPGARLFPTWNLEPLETVQARLGKASHRWRVVRVALRSGEMMMRVVRVYGRLELVSVPLD